MKNLKFLIFGVILVSLFSACDKTANTATPSSTTFLPKMDLHGESLVNVACGAEFTDEGITVTEGGASISHAVSTNGAYFGATEVSGADYYTIAYSATNKDGIPGSAFREVIIAPCNSGAPEDLSGIYTAHTLRNNGEGHNVSLVFLVKTGDNTFALSDCIGGFYDQGRGYGTGYACLETIITVNDISTNDFSASTGQFPIWPYTAEVTGIQKAADGTISFHTVTSFGGEWDVVLTPQ